MEMMFDVMMLAVNPDLGGEMTGLHAGTKSYLSYSTLRAKYTDIVAFIACGIGSTVATRDRESKTITA